MAELILTDDELALVRDQLADEPEWYELSKRLEAKTDEVGALRLLALGFVYRLNSRGAGLGSPTHSGPYDVMYSGPDGTYPPFPNEVQGPVREVWKQACAAIDDPIVHSRLRDLAFVADGGPAHADGRAAAEALIELSQRASWPALTRAQCLARAIDISRRLNDTAALTEHAKGALELGRELLIEQEHPGPPFIVLRALIGIPQERRPDGVDEAIRLAIERFEGTSHHVGALELAIDAATTKEQRQERQREKLTILVGEADNDDGIGQVSRLQKAIEFARSIGSNDDVVALTMRLQAIPPDSLQFETISETTEIPREEIDREADQVAGSGAEDLDDALQRIGQYGPPGGSIDDLKKLVDDAEDPISRLFSGPTVLSKDSAVPAYVASSPEDQEAHAIGQRRQLAAGFFSAVGYEPMLTRAVEHHGRPSHDDLTAIWTTNLIGAERAERIARALELFWDGHPDDAAHVLAPRLESILRDLAKHAGVLVHKIPRPSDYGGVVSLNTVMDKLVDLSDQDPWLCYLRDLLCIPLSINLRNTIAHGLTGTVKTTDAALLIQAACFLLSIQLPDSTPETHE